MPAVRRPRVLSGAQPTADSYHLGNYFGAFKQWVALQDEFEAFYFIPDLHAITVEYDPALLRERTYIAAAQLLAAGVDPERSALFVQSHVPEHAQLAWVLGGVTGFGEASRMTQFKDKSAKGGQDSASVGLFTYPILMAADILIYQADKVPVGEDQRQHVELTRNLAQRFNHRFGETFTVPEAYIVKSTAKIYDLQDPTSKMSGSNASHAGVVDLTDSPKQVAKKIRSAVTDSGSEITFDPVEKPGISNLLSIYSALTNEPVEQIVRDFEGKQYGHLKVALGDLVADFVGTFGDRTRELLDDRGELDRILARGAAQAREVAATTLDLVYERSGFVRRA
ncbi:tryptophan--tRNA ligase [Aeromicrobium sp. SMF47]|uniref:Tryptophan--tRNA ligase n=1 Tax=Aeromicrobium yanjiei TaxID=2662028 RepID=A0A5Q2MHF0_9ACTN|nr:MULTISPECIES: tryptophan--tRNA ligase [Aeromicrobium]MRJ75056.1 tryptophan--tRNA ligase [Aeromicrobium yanjiei]MRK02888.1 tryptophan--tRNA ligase [Aeromicrobium sp. S22]QGG40456.1 tryptophan--tRNA ligase [Aeromicrobium yanjiei]